MRAAPRAALAGALAGATIALLLAVAGAGVFGADEFFYACAGRELAAGRPAISHQLIPAWVDFYGFPYEEPHAKGGPWAIAAAFRLLGAREPVALVPGVLATVLSAVTAHAILERAGLGARAALAGAGLLSVAPFVAGLATTVYLEPVMTLGFLVVAAALVAEGRAAQAALAAAGTALATSHQETCFAVAPLLAPALYALARFRGEERRAALVRAALVSGAGVVAAALTLAVAAGPRFTSGAERGWVIAHPLMADYLRETFAAQGKTPPPLSVELLARRVLLMTPRMFWPDAAILRPYAASVLAVHLSALAAAAGLAKRSTPAVRALAVFAVTLYVAKLGFSILGYQEPGVHARHFAREGAVLLVAGFAALAERARGSEKARRPLLVLLALVALGSLAVDVLLARHRARQRETEERFTAALRPFAPKDGAAIATDNGWRLTWERPGVFAILSPAREETLDWLAQRVPIERLVLAGTDPLVAASLAETGKVPRRLGGFVLTTTDRTLGVTLLVYERRT